ncbi:MULTISPECIES: LytTR family DNA-binding domain-containing protein [unclassified Fusibacter]|uniref:LytR/AlgR family response regulator transcription factor n=1 Tax=unclassified Fusibacter TaxID=2624464 RepID=UPI00101283E6|nr:MULTISPECIES: LytTR family DNA-binding domain-containing protein [unclassified Fusibacter]MCK8058196.1 LytTR family DNA-binding domain-containing protein [Fusibacter sp. A2]NPE20779.1 response regulator transcription factor [Fusibacter sp. A1]RXV62985.1 DNA-binding response regulator [Fusibacter sp. A1]
MYKAILIDDERPALLELHYILAKDKRIDIIGIFQDPIEGIAAIEKEQPDVVFLDIHMPELDGLKLAERLSIVSPCVEIVFTTAYDQYALKAYDTAAIDYVLKPYDEKRLQTTIDRLIEHLNQHKEKNQNNCSLTKIPVWNNGVIKLISIMEINYFYTNDSKTFLVTTGQEYEISQSLKNMEDLLKSHPFMRTHKSFLVNLTMVQEIIPWFNATYMLMVKDEKEQIPVSRKQVKALKAYFNL